MKKLLALLLALSLCFGAAATLTAAGTATLTVSSASGMAGSTVTLTVTLSGAENASTMVLVPSYNTSKLEMLSGTWLLTGSTLSDNWNSQYGDAVISFENDTNMNGAIFEMVFRIKSDATGSSTVTLTSESIIRTSSQDINSAGISKTIVAGKVTVDKPIPEWFNDPVTLVGSDEVSQSASTGISFGIAGVQIRTESPAGLRYVARMSDELLAYLKTNFGAANVSYGILLQKESAVDDDLTEADITSGLSLANGGAIAVNGEKLFQTYDGYFYFTAAIYNMPVNSYEINIVARAYVKCGSTYYFATEDPTATYAVPGAGAVAGGYRVSLGSAARYIYNNKLNGWEVVQSLYPECLISKDNYIDFFGIIS